MLLLSMYSFCFSRNTVCFTNWHICCRHEYADDTVTAPLIRPYCKLLGSSVGPSRTFVQGDIEHLSILLSRVTYNESASHSSGFIFKDFLLKHTVVDGCICLTSGCVPVIVWL